MIFLREILTISESLADEVYENASDIPKKKVYRYWSTLFYQNFWSYPFEIRTLIIERLLTVGDSEAHFEKAFHLIVKRLFPDGTQYAKEAHEILQTYLSILKIGQKSLFLSALIATAEQAQEKQSSAGEKLAMILELMGPAEIKLGQQINSFPQTPEDIRKPVGRLKTNAREPFRWDIFELRDKVLPPEELANIKWTGSVLGSASYYVTFEYKTPAGKKEVLSLLRPWSKDRADQGFAHLLKFLEQFSGDPVLRDTIADLTKEAQKNVVVETSHEFAQKQFANSKRVYNNKSIVVKGSGVKDLNISLNFVDLLAAGPGYRRMSIAEGVHFSELPSTTPEQKALKQDIARAYLIMEFYAILRGYEFDHDRHGGQMRVLVKDPHNVEIGLFDAGAMSLEPPTTLMRKALGKLWFECIMEMYSNSELQNSDLGKIILEKRKAFSQKLNGGLSAEEREKFDRYLISVEKALLTLGEFMQEFDEDKRTQELTNIVRTILKEDLIHPEIKKGFDAKGLEKMGAFYGVILEQFKNTDDCSKSFVLGNFP